jgi:hypothetical protein
MNEELKTYLKTEAIISAAFNFFINGMLAALIHHKADYVATDAISVVIDLAATCLPICIITALFCMASVKRAKTLGILETGSRMIRFLSRLFRRPVLFGILTGIAADIVLSALTVSILALLGIQSLPFGVYVALKCVFSALMGCCATVTCLYAGMYQTNWRRSHPRL